MSTTTYVNNKTQTQAKLHNFLFEPNIYIAALITLKGDLTAEDIAAAVKKAYTQNETTMSKVILENGKAYFQTLSETGCKVSIDTRDWREIMHQSEKDTFRINEGELIRTYIIPREDAFLLFVMAHHIVGDGTSLVLFTEDILNDLAGKEVAYRPLNDKGVINVPRTTKFPIKSLIGLKLLNQKWKKTGKVFTWEDYFHIHEAFWKNRQSDIRIKEIEENELRRIKSECKELGITVNSYVFNMLLRERPESKTISFPFSTRGTNRALSNQVMTIKIPYKYNNALSFEENAKNVHKAIYEHLENDEKKFHIAIASGLLDPILMDGALMHTYTGYENEAAEQIAHIWGYIGDEKSDLGVTNIKNVDIETDYTTFAVKDFAFIAAGMSSTKDVVSVSTLKNRMTLCDCNITNMVRS